MRRCNALKLGEATGRQGREVGVLDACIPDPQYCSKYLNKLQYCAVRGATGNNKQTTRAKDGRGVDAIPT